MALKNYSSTVDASKTIGEIQQKLVEHGARSIMIDYDDSGRPRALIFVMEVSGEPFNFRLPCNYEGMLRAMKQDKGVGNSYCTMDQAVRTTWRNIKDWVESQLALVEAEQATIEQVFLPYAITSQGQTLFEMVDQKPKMLKDTF